MTLGSADRPRKRKERQPEILSLRQMYAYSQGRVSRGVQLRHYTDELCDFIATYKASPPDIKFWPYGPYWPEDFRPVLHHPPKHIREIPADAEPFLELADCGRCRK